MGKVIQFPTPKQKAAKAEEAAVSKGRGIPQHVYDEAAKHNLVVSPAGTMGYFIDSKTFTTPKGVKVGGGFGYMRATGGCREVNEVEEIEVHCLRTGKTKWLPLRLLQPFRFVDDLGD